MRRLSLTNKKLRNIPRHLRALTRGAESFKGCFYEELPLRPDYINLKNPVIENLVEGNQTTLEILAHCAQQMIKVAGHLVEARSEGDPECWILACIMVPDMFSSRVCVYTDKARYLGHTSPLTTSTFAKPASSADALPANWGLVLRRSQHDR